MSSNKLSENLKIDLRIGKLQALESYETKNFRFWLFIFFFNVLPFLTKRKNQEIILIINILLFYHVKKIDRKRRISFRFYNVHNFFLHLFISAWLHISAQILGAKVGFSFIIQQLNYKIRCSPYVSSLFMLGTELSLKENRPYLPN